MSGAENNKRSGVLRNSQALKRHLQDEVGPKWGLLGNSYRRLKPGSDFKRDGELQIQRELWVEGEKKDQGMGPSLPHQVVEGVVPWEGAGMLERPPVPSTHSTLHCELLSPLI